MRFYCSERAQKTKSLYLEYKTKKNINGYFIHLLVTIFDIVYLVDKIFNF